jgi:uncharacterized protein
MSLFDQVSQDLKAAMLAKEKDKLESLRAIKTAFLNAKSEKGAGELTPDKELQIIQKLVKQRKESAEIYKEQNRNDLYQKEMDEAKVIEVYLPKQMNEQELTEVLKEIIARAGASSPADMGKVMGIASKELSGKADGKTIATKVRELLS